MDPRIVLLRAAALLVLPLAAMNGCGGEPAPKAQHLLFITVDTLRTDRLGCYGAAQSPSPNIDRLAREGTLFQDAYAQRAVTLPSMTSFFTSKYPYEHGVLNNLKRVPDAEWLLAERLQAAGFHTRAYSASGVLMPERNNVEQGYKPNAYSFFPDEEVMTGKAEKFIRERFGERGRQFLWVHYMNPHKPYDPPAPYDRLFDPEYQGAFDGSGETLDRIYVERIDLAAADRRHIEAVYDGTIAFVDRLIGRLLAALEETGQAADTLVVFAADHGEDLYSHNYYYYHANSTYRSSTSIPLIFRQPGAVAAGQAVTGMVETVDFMPTVLCWLAADPGTAPGGDTALRGNDLSQVLAGQGAVRKDFAYALVDQDVDEGRSELIFSVRNRDWMYVWNESGVHPDNPPEAGEYPIAKQELYHLPSDPDEQKNIVEQHPEVAEKLYRAINAWRERMTQRLLADEASATHRAELERLGYLGGSGKSRPPVEQDGGGTGGRQRR
ncbi:MAG: sulfatase [Planctomycetes bacterium]|nr:sulfatase [Planctomycetota bacterium]